MNWFRDLYLFKNSSSTWGALLIKFVERNGNLLAFVGCLLNFLFDGRENVRE